jgi:hypothetical protein
MQAPLPSPIWVHLPRGYRSQRPGRTCLRLIDWKLKLYSHSFITRLIWSYDMTPTPHPVQRCSVGK